MFGDWLAQELNQRGWSHSELGRRAGVSQAQVSGVIGAQRSPGCEFCIKVANALGEPPEKLMRLAGILPPTGEGDTLQEIIELARTLPPDEQETVLAFVRFIILQKRRG